MRTLLIVLGMGCAAACSHDPVIKTPAQATTTATSTRTADPSGARQHDVVVSDEIARQCDLHFGNVDQAPKFDFDQAALLPDDQSVLGQVAQCVTTGPLRGRSVRLIGRADPRGEIEYNFVLGESRSAVVKQFLSSHGVEGGRISTTSRGKLDASGTDEDGWRRDRRVDVVLDNKI
jgi:peptidoglycan-associated lipoprotein